MKYALSIIALTLSFSAYSKEDVETTNCDELYAGLSSAYENIVMSTGEDHQTRTFKMKAVRLIYIEEAYSCRGHGTAMKLMARINIEAFENSTALEYAKAAVSANASDAESNNILGTLFGLLNDYESGLPYLEKAASLDPRFTYDLCSNYEMAKFYEKAIEACTKAVSIAETPERKGSATYVRGRAYRALNRMAEAEEDFEFARKVGFDGDQYYADEHLKTEHNHALHSDTLPRAGER